MGACSSNLSPEEEEAGRRNREINKQLKRDREKQSVKLLLLGTGICSILMSAEEEIKKLEPKHIYLDHAFCVFTKEEEKH